MSGSLRDMRERGQRGAAAGPGGAGRTPYSWPENAMPTDEQVAAWLTICTPEERLERVRWWREQGERGFRCAVEGHVRRLDQLDRAPGPGRHRADDEPGRL